MPNRIQRKRVKGWKMPPNTVYVGRPTKWGNPFSIMQAIADAARDLNTMDLEYKDPIYDSANDVNNYSRAILIQKYKNYLTDHPNLVYEAKQKLRGKNLACWCKEGEPCHADILLEIANS